MCHGLYASYERCLFVIYSLLNSKVPPKCPDPSNWYSSIAVFFMCVCVVPKIFVPNISCMFYALQVITAHLSMLPSGLKNLWIIRCETGCNGVMALLAFFREMSPWRLNRNVCGGYLFLCCTTCWERSQIAGVWCVLCPNVLCGNKNELS